MVSRRELLFSLLRSAGSCLLSVSLLDDFKFFPLRPYKQTILIRANDLRFTSAQQFSNKLNEEFDAAGFTFKNLKNNRRNGKIVKEQRKMIDPSTMKLERIWRKKLDYLTWKASYERERLQDFLDNRTEYQTIS